MANSCKYYKQKKQFSTNSGQTWQDVTPFEYRRGSFIEADSPDCREGTLISRWVTVPDAFVCDGKDKYEKRVGQYSLDNGATWQYYYPSLYQSGNLIEANADICNNKWEGYYEFTGSTGNICPEGYVYIDGRGCVTIPQYMSNPDPVKYIRCSSNTSVVLTRGDVYYNNVYDVYSGKIGDCVTEIDHGAFNSFYSLTGITIPDSVTSIGYDAFWYCTGLTSINIPDSVTSIGYDAFGYCTSLTSATIGSGITSISEGLFYNCSGLTNVTIGNSVTSIGQYAFQNCRSLASINIPDNVTSIGQWAFAECSSLTSVTIGSGITSITSATFADCSSLTSITIPSGVTRIGDGAFSGCTSLTSVTIEATTPPTLVNTAAFSNTNNCPIYVPCDVVNTYRSASGWRDYALRIVGIPPCGIGTTKYIATYVGGSISSGACDGSNTIIKNEIPRNGILSVEIIECVSTIEHYAFVGFTTLTSVTISNTVTSIEYGAFWRCTSLSSITIPDSVTSIGTDVFANCESLSSIIIPSGVTSIGDFTFSGCTSLTSVTIPNNVTYIGMNVFANCTSLPNITIPSGVTRIDGGVFSGCTSLTSVTIEATTPPNLYYGGAFDNTNDCPIYVPCGSVNTYKSASGWSTYASRIVGNCPKWTATYSDSHTESAQCGSSSAITNNEITKSGLTSVEIGDCVTSIGQNVFSGCTSLTSITIPNSVTSIGGGAFQYCSGLTSVTIPSGVTTIEGWTFYNCDGLTSITIPSGVTSIGTSAFMSCSNIEDITIPNTVTSIGTYTFSSCISLQTVTLPNSITTLPDSTFRECDNLAMINSENIGEFNIPSGVITLGYGLFTSCYALQYLIIPSTVTTIEKNILQGCRNVLIECNAVNPPALTDTLGGSIAQIRVPSASVEAYKSASGWSQYANKIYSN